jgi:molybdenum cofactor cytidylyltransferase
MIVVTGNNAESLAPIVNSNHAILVRNPAPERGQFSSLQTGLRELVARGCNAAMITPVDCPPLRTESLQLLCAGFDRALHRGLRAVAPENNGKHGHPLLISRNMIEALLAAPVTGTARQVLHANAQQIEYISVPDRLAKTGLNTPADYVALAAKNSLK